MFGPPFDDRIPKLFAKRRPRLGHAASVVGRVNHEREPACSRPHFGASPYQGFKQVKKLKLIDGNPHRNERFFEHDLG